MNISNMKLFKTLTLVCVISFGMVFAGSGKKVTKKVRNVDIQEILQKPKVLCIQKGKTPKLVDLDIAIKELETKLRKEGVDVNALYENFDSEFANKRNKRDAKKIYSWAQALYHLKNAALHIKDGVIIVAWLTADFIRTKIYPLVYPLIYVDPIEQFEQVVEAAQEVGDLIEDVGLIEGKKQYDEVSDEEYARMLQQWEYEQIT